METKLQKVRAAMANEGIEALFVTDELNQRYLLGYPFTDGFLLILPDASYMVTDFRYYEEAQQKADPAFEIIMPSPRTAFVADLLEKAGVKVAGYETATLSVDAAKAMESAYPSVTFKSIGRMFSTLRAIKDETELAKMAKAQEITDAAFAHILKVMTPNMTEIEVALELEFFMRKNGAEALAFETISVSGAASALPHGKPRNVPLQKGFLTMDFGAAYDGYCSDMTRTVVIGRADDEIKRLYNTVLRAQTEAIAVIAAGMEAKAVDAVARNIIDSVEDYKGAFGHSLGHGVGLFIHESPGLSTAAKDVLLQVGHVVTVEPGIYLQGKYGCRIEDMVAVTENGCHNFTKSPKGLIELF